MGKESKILLISDDKIECKEMINYMNSNPDLQLVSATNNIYVWSIQCGSLNEEEDSILETSVQKLKKAEELREIRSAKFDKIGMRTSLNGRRYLLDALMLLDEGVDRQELCEMIASKYEKSPQTIRAAMKRAIQTTWATMPTNILQENYTARLRPNKKAPTVMEFLHYYT